MFKERAKGLGARAQIGVIIGEIGAFADDAKYLKALPGAGQIVTNVSVGDLTDQSMADAGDAYVQDNGPTTILKNGQRYLDIPTLPSVEGQQPPSGQPGASATPPK